MTTEKLTDRMIYEAIADAATTQTVVDLPMDELVAWAQKKITQLDNKAAKAKANAAAKRAEGDALTDVVIEALSDEFETIADIAARIEGDDVTVSKVSYRLNALAQDENSGVEKSEISIKSEGSKARRLVAYRRVNLER